ncbi:UNVERIFIED_CONTAM: hypothetical protein RMT77_012827 [Armadillidium vulgare]
MRSLEDEYLPDDVSEDENPATDTSEDSVEVSVTPVARPNYAQLSRLPRKFRKAFEKDLPLATSPIDFSVTPLGEGSLDRPPQGISPESHAGGGGGRGVVASPKSKLNRRKPSEPRRIIDHESVTVGTRTSSKGLKRAYEEEWRTRKELKLDIPHRLNEEIPPQHPSILGHSPFINPFANPHLLLPPTWTHMARYPYAHLVGSVLAPPIGLLPSAPYPLLPLLPPRAHPTASPSNLLSEGTNLPEVEEKPHLNGIPSTSSTIVPPPVAPSSEKPKSCSKKFLSVESLLNPTEIKSEAKDTSLTPVVPSEGTSIPEGSDHLSPSSPSNDVDIQNLLHRPSHSKQKQRNYKNMTRERRIEANARERSRVHTISAAFETLRRAVPSFSHNQKLSKLSVLRIASAYILSLSRLAGYDYSEGGASPSFEECVDLTTRTIQVEGKAKKKRDD